MIATTNSVHQNLKETRKSLLLEKERIDEMLQQIDTLLKIFEEAPGRTNGQADDLNMSEGPTPFVRSLLRSEPTQRWRPAEVVAALRASAVKTTSKNLHVRVGSILKNLTEKTQVVERTGTPRKYRYKWKTTAD